MSSQNRTTRSGPVSNRIAGRPVTRSPLSKRGMRAARRAYERQRRLRIGSAVAAVVVVALAGWLLISRLNAQPTVHTAAVTYNCPAPTATPIGPAPVPTPPQKMPAVTGTVVNAAQGLQYIDLKQGCGPAVKSGDNITVMYNGYLQSTGVLFDSSLNHGGTFAVTNIGQAQLISGWNLGIIGMKPGGERRLIIPAALGYGTAGSPPVIPPNATLVFDITLVSINK